MEHLHFFLGCELQLSVSERFLIVMKRIWGARNRNAARSISSQLGLLKFVGILNVIVTFMVRLNVTVL